MRDDLHEARPGSSRRAGGRPPASRCALRAPRAGRAISHPRRRRAPRGRRAAGCSARANAPSSSSTYAIPPLIPAAKLRPVGPSTTTSRRSCTRSRDRRRPRRRRSARVAHREPLAGAAPEERAPGGRAVEHGVADDHVLLRREGAPRAAAARRSSRRRGPCRRSRSRRRSASARSPARARRRTTGPPSRGARSGSSRRQAGAPVALRDVVREQAADRPVDVAHGEGGRHRLGGVQRR